MHEHGTNTRYTNHKCRCNLCKKAHSEYGKLYYKNGKIRSRSPLIHGTSLGYKTWKCRCDSCISAYRKYRRENYKKRTAEKTINQKIAANLRSRTSKIVSGIISGMSFVSNLGCTINDFLLYLEDRFEDGMSWDNYGIGSGKWNIDHIKPLNVFDLSDRNQFLEACHYTNMRPMWHIDNISRPRDGKDVVFTG